MKIPFTPAVERVLARAAGWSVRAEIASIELPETLLALLAEPECRAAELLTHHGIDQAAVLLRWPQLTARSDWAALRDGDFAPPLRAAIQEAREWLGERGERELATEHLLLGIVRGTGGVSAWLTGHGLDAEAVARSIGAGEVSSTPLEMEDEVGVEMEISDGERGSTLTPTLSLGGRGSSRDADSGILRAETEETAVWRVLDASGNRGREGLRVVEDYVRFVLDDRHLTERVKGLRHDLSAAMETLPERARLVSRDTPADVGTTVTVPSEGTRADASSVAVASLKRTGEAFRSLEEFGKVVDANFAARIEALRYRLYTLEKAIGITAASMERLGDARLYVLLDGRESLDVFRNAARGLIDAGVDVVQLRDKRMADRELLERAHVLRELTRDSNTLFIMNDRPDLALLADTDGVHVGQEELAVRDVRKIVGPRMLVGVSTHSLPQAEKAVLDGADYLGLGPTFPSKTKSFTEFPGLEFLRAASDAIRLPAFAIGGITLENLPLVLEAGARRVAVSSAVTQAQDPGAAAQAFRRALRG